MKKMILASMFLMFAASHSMAQQADLDLPGEKWIAKFDKYVCAAFGPAVARPTAFEDLKVNFSQITTDSTLDNGLIKASFEQDGHTCRYSAIILADNAASSMKLVRSHAYSEVEGAADCLAGQAVIDASLAENKYLYYGHPHNLAIMLPGVGAEAVCGAGAEFIGANFVVSGRVK